ncbi:MAG: tRNA pseudouridine(55) synthase TruB [Pseudomonadota bacterium]
MMASPPPLSGWLNLNKPEHMSSAHAIAKVKHALKRIVGYKPKIGHTGTLDPFASGVLPIAIGEATKLSQFFLDHQKSYTFEVTWGTQYDTGDPTGDIIDSGGFIPNEEAIRDVLPDFIGQILQKPHRYSAVKVNGQRAYKLARNGEDFSLKHRDITIYDLSIIEHFKDKTSFKVSCSKGTYIRVLAEDIARTLGTKGYVSRLIRTEVGAFTLKDAITLDSSDNMIYKAVCDLGTGLGGIPAISISQEEASKIQMGQKIGWQAPYPDCDRFILRHDHNILAIASYEKGYICPKRVLNI